MITSEGPRSVNIGVHRELNKAEGKPLGFFLRFAEMQLLAQDISFHATICL